MKDMLFSHEEKNMLIGAFATAGVDMALEGYYAYRDGGGYQIRNHPEDPMYYIYYEPNAWIPPVDDLISLIGVPALFWAVGKWKHSAKWKDMAFGGAIYGASELIGWTVLKATRYAAGQPIYSYKVIGVP